MLYAAIIIATIAAIGFADRFSGRNVSFRPIYYIPIAMAVVWFNWRIALMVSIVSLVVWRLTDTLSDPVEVGWPVAIWNGVIMAISFFGVVWLLHHLVALQREMQRRVRERTISLEQSLQTQERLQVELLNVAARERNALGHDLHDGLCQHLTATAMATQVLVENLAAQKDPNTSHAAKVLALIEDGIQQCRTLARTLLPSPVKPRELLMQLDELARSTSRDHGIRVDFRTRGTSPSPADPQAADSFFRIAQEAVRNAVKHARPTRIDVMLAGAEDGWTLEVRDDGCGIPANAELNGGLGLALMHQRVAMLKAEFDAGRDPRGGTRILVRLPRPVAPS